MEKERHIINNSLMIRENTLKKNDEEMEEEMEMIEQLHETMNEAESTLFIK